MDAPARDVGILCAKVVAGWCCQRCGRERRMLLPKTVRYTRVMLLPVSCQGCASERWMPLPETCQKLWVPLPEIYQEDEEDGA